jgi:hypothetical protein
MFNPSMDWHYLELGLLGSMMHAIENDTMVTNVITLAH